MLEAMTFIRAEMSTVRHCKPFRTALRVRLLNEIMKQCMSSRPNCSFSNELSLLSPLFSKLFKLIEITSPLHSQIIRERNLS
jgi:hypothetical protein